MRFQIGKKRGRIPHEFEFKYFLNQNIYIYIYICTYTKKIYIYICIFIYKSRLKICTETSASKLEISVNFEIDSKQVNYVKSTKVQLFLSVLGYFIWNIFFVGQPLRPTFYNIFQGKFSSLPACNPAIWYVR